MILKLLPLALLQCILLTSGQVLMKIGLTRVGDFSFTWNYFGRLFTNWQFCCCGLCYAAGSILWMYIVKHFPFSMAYPMVSLSYVFGMIAAVLFFHEDVSMTRWMGALLIVLGCVFLAK